MSQRDGFGSGFVVGTIVGGVVGGIMGALISYRHDAAELPEDEDVQRTNHTIENKKVAAKRRQMKPSDSSESMEMARRSLEDKIAQLNATIDEVRQQLGNVNGNSGQANNERPITKDS